MKNIAFLFPGQGAQYPGMGKDFFESFVTARRIFEEADDLLHFHLSQIIFEGPEDVLTETRYSQTAIFVNSIAILRVLQEQFPELSPQVCSGLSLGEYTALFASQRLGFREALQLVHLRGALLNEACQRTQGTMAAVLGLASDEIEEVVRFVSSSHPIWVANFNCPGQTVISGSLDGVRVASEMLKTKGAKRVIPLQVHGAFHSGMMQMAQDRLAPAIMNASIVDSSIQFVMNVDGSYVSHVEDVKKNLIRQVTHSVRWEQGIRAMMDQNIVLYVEIGCGKTLTGLNKKIGIGDRSVSLEKVAELDHVVHQFDEAARI